MQINDDTVFWTKRCIIIIKGTISNARAAWLLENGRTVLTCSDWETVAQVTQVDEFHSLQAVGYCQGIAANPELGRVFRIWLIWAWSCKYH